MPERMDRVQRRQILRQDEAWVGKAIDLSASRRGAEAHTRHLALMLLDTDRKRRATQAAQYAARVLDAALAKHTAPPVACKKGCHYCCKTLVTATVPEILRLARALGGKAAKQERVTLAAAKSKIIPQAEREVNRIICPILEDQSCSEYAERPLLCRAAYSTSLDTCLRIFEDNSDDPFPYAGNTLELRRRMTAIMQAALMVSGLPHYYYELNQGLAAVMQRDDAEERWLAGEPVFAAVDMNAYEFKNAAHNDAVQRLAATVKATL